MAWPWWTVTGFLALVLLAGSTWAQEPDPTASPDAPPSRAALDETASPGKEPASLGAPETPIADSIELVVERYIREHYTPCGPGDDAVPCFPVTLVVKGRQYSVRESLENLEFDSRPVPGAPPTAAEMIQHGANPHPTSASVGVDPKTVACKTKQLLRRIQGRSQKYYLYRVWDETGERAVLRDRPLDPNELARSPEFRYVPLGEFGDECEAMRAYLATTHDVRYRREATEGESWGGEEVRPHPDAEPE
jgi:hypothetical protein